MGTPRVRTVAYFLDSDAFGGAERVALDILAGLDRRCWRPILFHHPEPGLAPLLMNAKDLDVELHEVPRASGPFSLGIRWPHFIKQLLTYHPTIFHAHLNYPFACRGALIAAALARVPAVVATMHLFPQLQVSRRGLAVQQLVAFSVDCYIAVSHEIARRLLQTFHVPAAKIRVVHNGVVLSQFDVSVKPELRAALKGDTRRPIVLVTGRLHEQKGHHYLLQAATLVPEAVFVLVGEGPERATLETQARELRVENRVLFMGHREDIANLLACADLFVLPSLFEGLSVSVLEAMAAGKPVIVTDVEGNAELVTHGETGLLVPPRDPAALAAAIRTLLHNPQLARRLAAAGKERAHDYFSAASMIRQVTEIYEHILSRR